MIQRASPRETLADLATQFGEAEFAHRCATLLVAPDVTAHAETVRQLGGGSGDQLLQGLHWKPYWARVWAARGLLYVWHDDAAPAVLAGLSDDAWRVAEMCLKVCARRGLPPGEDAVRLTTYRLPRVRAAAVRALGVAGDTEHVGAVLAATDDPDPDVRRAADGALEAMRARLDLPRLPDPPDQWR